MEQNLEPKKSIQSCIESLRQTRLALTETRLHRPDLVAAFQRSLSGGVHEEKRRRHTDMSYGKSPKSRRSSKSSRNLKPRAHGTAPPTRHVLMCVESLTASQQSVEIEPLQLLVQQQLQPSHLATMTPPAVTQQDVYPAPLADGVVAAAHQSTVGMTVRGPTTLHTDPTLTPTKVSPRQQSAESQTPQKVANLGGAPAMGVRGKRDRQSSLNSSVAPEVCSGAQNGEQSGVVNRTDAMHASKRLTVAEDVMGLNEEEGDGCVEMESSVREEKYNACAETPENAEHGCAWEDKIEEYIGVELRHDFLVESESPELHRYTSEVEEKVNEAPEVVSFKVGKIETLRVKEETGVKGRADAAVEKTRDLSIRRARLEELQRRTHQWNEAVKALRCQVHKTCWLSPRQVNLAVC
eukprot:GEMP01054119.1.p1 GENE.GEMP01054119.1~~GEMP01054119.1.p1  ORF type:complete len:408 (+),score=101.83 GEMP01054119.1:89-1312(+)